MLERNVDRNINLLCDKSVNEGCLVGEVNDSNFVEIDIFCIPVILESGVNTLAAWGEADEFVTACTNLSLAVVASLGDCVGVTAKHRQPIDVWQLEIELNGEVVFFDEARRIKERAQWLSCGQL